MERPAIPPGQPQHEVLWNPQLMPPRAPSKVSRHTQSTQGTTTYKTIPSTVAVPPTSWKQTKKVKHKEETEEYAPNKRTRQKLRKRPKEKSR